MNFAIIYACGDPSIEKSGNSKLFNTLLNLPKEEAYWTSRNILLLCLVLQYSQVLFKVIFTYLIPDTPYHIKKAFGKQEYIENQATKFLKNIKNNEEKKGISTYNARLKKKMGDED